MNQRTGLSIQSPRKIRTNSPLLIAIGLCAALGTSYAATDKAKLAKDKFKKGVLHGKVYDLTGKPVPNAIVALKQPNGKVLAWTKTDGEGQYELAADTKLALNLRPSRSLNLLEQCAREMGEVAMMPIRAVGTMIADPGPVVHSAAVAIASGTPGPVVAQAAQAALPNSATPGQTLQAEGGAATDAALTPTKGGVLPPPAQRGQAFLMISADGYKDADMTDAPYWLDPPSEDKKDQIGVQAYMQTIRLAPEAGDKKPDVVVEAVTLSEGQAKPSLIPIGTDVNLKVRLDTPDPAVVSKVRIFARLACKETVVELVPSEKDPCLFTGVMHIDPKTPEGQSVICIGALRIKPINAKLNPKKADPLFNFVSRSDDMDGTKAYGYDPFVMAGENRVDLKVVLLSKSE